MRVSTTTSIDNRAELTITMLKVSWLRDGAPISQSGRVHYSHSHGEEFSLRLRTVSASDLGNYTCSLSLVAGARHLDSATIILDKRPPPPLFVGLKDGVNRTSQLLTWTGNIELQLTFDIQSQSLSLYTQPAAMMFRKTSYA